MTLPPPRVSRITCFSSLINIYGQSLSIQCTNIYVQRAQHLRLQYHGIWRPSRLSPVKQVPCQARGRQKPLYTSDLVEIPPPPPTPESPPTQTMILLPLFIYTILLIHQRKLGLRLLMPLFFIIASSIINTINGILLGGLCQVAIVHWVLSPEKPLRVPNTSPNSNLKTRVPKEASSERIPYGSRVL